MKIILIRHGVTITNKQKIYSLDDSPLAAEAYPQLDILKQKLNAYKFTKVYASPFKRAMQTAAYLGFTNIIIDERLQEYNFGAFKGFTFNELEKKYPVEVKEWIEKNETYAPPFGETSINHFNRVSQFLDEITARNEDCVLVTHYGTITMALGWCLDNFDLRNKFAPKNSCLTVLQVFKNDSNIIKTIEQFNL